jgi:hypothetical protein
MPKMPSMLLEGFESGVFDRIGFSFALIECGINLVAVFGVGDDFSSEDVQVCIQSGEDY